MDFWEILYDRIYNFFHHFGVFVISNSWKMLSLFPKNQKENLLIPKTNTRPLLFYILFLNNLNSVLFIKLIRGCTSSIACKIGFGIICLTPACNTPCKRSFATKYYHQKLGGIQRINTKHTMLYWYNYEKTIISSCIKNILLKILLRYVNPKQNSLWCIAPHAKFLHN